MQTGKLKVMKVEEEYLLRSHPKSLSELGASLGRASRDGGQFEMAFNLVSDLNSHRSDH